MAEGRGVVSRAAGWLVAVAIAAIAGYWLGLTQRDGGLAEYQRITDTVRVETVRLDTLYQKDTIRLTRWKTRYDTARVTDTVVRGDTVYVPRDVADSAVTACLQVVETCEARVSNLTVRLRLADSTLADWHDSSRRPDPVKVGAIASVITFILTLVLSK